jgi:hypothetical protein
VRRRITAATATTVSAAAKVEVTANATDPTSLSYQERFADAVPDVVVGKPIERGPGLATGGLQRHS